jgi:hypothetical protein
MPGLVRLGGVLCIGRNYLPQRTHVLGNSHPASMVLRCSTREEASGALLPCSRSKVRGIASGGLISAKGVLLGRQVDCLLAAPSAETGRAD